MKGIVSSIPAMVLWRVAAAGGTNARNTKGEVMENTNMEDMVNMNMEGTAITTDINETS